MLMDIPGHSNYLLSEDGVVYKRYTMAPIGINMSNGNARVTLDGVNYYLGKLMLSIFKKNEYRTGYKVFYIDGDKTNNNLNNLIWLSPSDIQLYSSYKIEYRIKMLSRARE